ncbi:MAG: DUF1697 domain-containing protein [Phycisphaerales bacterium]
MPVGIAFLRGINVGGKHTLPMETLRGLCEGLGLRDARTYIQSGNVVFSAGKRELAKAAAGLEGAIEKRCGFRPRVVVRTLEEVRGVIAGSPFGGGRAGPAVIDGTRLLVMFLAEEPSEPAKKAVGAIKANPERVRLMGRDLYMDFPNGLAKSTLPMGALEKAVGVAGTVRNWNTVRMVVEMGGTLEVE